MSADELVLSDGPLLAPIRFVQMVRPCSGPECRRCSDGTRACGPDNVSFDDLRGRVQQANQVFGAASLRFYVERVDTYAMPHFHDLTSDTELAWSVVRDELRTMLTFPDALFAETDAFSSVIWLAHISALAQPPNEVLVVLAENASQAWGFYPQEGRVVIETPSDMSASTWNFSHELGHYMGLSHSFGAPWNTMQWDLHPGYLVNPAAQRPIVLSDFWDLVYKPGTPNTYYRDRASAERDEAALKTIDGTDPPHACASNVRCCATRCAVSCNIDGEVRQHEDPALAGVAITTIDGDPPLKRRGPNVMSYMPGGPDLGCRVGLAASQVLQIRRVLHWDVANTSFAGVTGGRPALGRGAAPNPPRRDR